MSARSPSVPEPPPPLPPLFEWAAPAAWRRIDFVSDLHLASALPRTFDAWATHLLHTPADAVLMLGDVFEVWVGDDQRGGAFEQHCVQVLAEAASRRCIGFMPGNRDFLLGEAMRRDGGLMALADPTALDAWGQRLLLTHGDALCLADNAYQRFRAESRSERWQRDFAALPLAERLARAGAARAESDRRRRAQPFDPALWADVDPAAAVAWMHAAGCHDLIHGHTHRPGDEVIAPGYTRHVLTDWDLDGAGRARAEVLRLTRDGLARVAPSRAG
ncbi:MAG: UDP-2,3-diacylglucosamine diphosphatase [Burkholderiales bacterium]|nr:UDP-2,3-diacylglucosamine diphosphatase [Burkholderiales bacterium]